MSFFKGIFTADPQQDVRVWEKGRQSAETKASSSQSAIAQQKLKNDGLSPHEALEQYGQELTEFERIELGVYERIYTIGKIRR